MDPDGDALGATLGDSLGLTLGASVGSGVGVAIGRSSPPWPRSRALSMISVNTATVRMTKAFDQSSRTWTATSEGVGAR